METPVTTGTTESSRGTSSPRRISALILASGLIAGCGSHGKPSVVAEVPAQIDYKKEQSEYDPSNPPIWPVHYYFGLEQCPEDIETAEADEPVTEPNFDPATHTYDPECFIREVEVPREMYNRYDEGDVLSFDGTAGEPIGRVIG